MTNSRQYQNEALVQANKNTDSNFKNTLNNLKNTNSPSPKPSSVQTTPNKGTGNTTCPIWQKSDETYSMMIQNMLLQSTIKWYVASNQDERDKIVQDANYIRDKASKGAGWWLEHAKELTESTLDILNGWVDTPESISKFQRDELLEVVNVFQDITISNSNSNTRQGMGFIVGLFTGTSEEKIALKGVNSLIKESNTLVKAAEKAGSSEAVQSEINSLVKQFISGNANPGIGSKHLINDIYYLRGREGSRVFYRVKDGVFEILGKASKENEQQVIDTVKKLYKKEGRNNLMKIKKISYAEPLAKIKDIENGNIDVFVEDDKGMVYTFVVTTPKNYYWYMDKEGLDFIPASPPDIIVRSLTEENIKKAIESYLEENGYWFKVYYLSGERTGAFDMKLMNDMIDEIRKNNDEIFNKD